MGEFWIVELWAIEVLGDYAVVSYGFFVFVISFILPNYNV